MKDVQALEANTEKAMVNTFKLRERERLREGEGERDRESSDTAEDHALQKTDEGMSPGFR